MPGLKFSVVICKFLLAGKNPLAINFLDTFRLRLTLPDLALKLGAIFWFNQKPPAQGTRSGPQALREARRVSGRGCRAAPNGGSSRGARRSLGEPREAAERASRRQWGSALGEPGCPGGYGTGPGGTHRPKGPALGSAPGEKTKASPGVGDLSGPRTRCATGEAFPRGVLRPGNVLYALRSKQRGRGGGGSEPKSSSGIWCTCQRGESGSP